MNKEEEGFVILNQSGAAGRLLYNYMKIYESFLPLLTVGQCHLLLCFLIIYADPNVHTVFFSITSSLI